MNLKKVKAIIIAAIGAVIGCVVGLAVVLFILGKMQNKIYPDIQNQNTELQISKLK